MTSPRAERRDPVPYLEGAFVAGWSASILHRLLNDAFRRGDFRNFPPDALRRFKATDEAIRLAAEAYARRIAAPDVSANGSPETSSPETVAHSTHDHLSIDEAAGILGVSDRRIRQMAPALGVKHGGRWLLDPALVDDELERRQDQRRRAS